MAPRPAWATDNLDAERTTQPALGRHIHSGSRLVEVKDKHGVGGVVKTAVKVYVAEDEKTGELWFCWRKHQWGGLNRAGEWVGEGSVTLEWYTWEQWSAGGPKHALTYGLLPVDEKNDLYVVERGTQLTLNKETMRELARN